MTSKTIFSTVEPGNHDSSLEKEGLLNFIYDFFLGYPIAWILVIALYYAYGLFLGETIPLNGKIGWDGFGYMKFTESFFGQPSIDSYHLTRVIPAFLAYLPLKFFSIAPSMKAICKSYYLMHAVMIISAAILYFKCLCKLNLKREYQSLGLILFFFNVMVAKFFPYYPILMDQDGFFWATLSLYFYIHQKNTLLALITPLAAFSWAVVLPFNLLLILFPRNKNGDKSGIILIEKYSNHLFHFAIATAIFMAIAIYIELYDPDPLIGNITRYTWYPKSSLVVTGIYAAYVFYYFSKISPKSLINGASLRSAMTVICVLIGWFCMKYAVSHYWINVIPDDKASALYGIKAQFWYNGVRPALFLVAHAVFFGLVYLLMLVYFDKFARSCFDFGLGMSLVVWLSLLAMIGIETRMWIYCFPFISLACIHALSKVHFHKTVLFFWLMLAVFVSRIWYPFNTNGGPEDGSLIDFPGQHYFMTQGPWMSWNSFRLQGSVALLLLIAFAVIRYITRERQPLNP